MCWEKKQQQISTKRFSSYSFFFWNIWKTERIRSLISLSAADFCFLWSVPQLCELWRLREMQVWLWIKTPHIFLGLVLTYFSSEQLRCSLPHILSNNNPCLSCFHRAHQWDDPTTASFMSMLSVQREEYREQLWKLEVNPISYFLFCFVVDALAPLSLLLYICAIKYI